MSKSLLQFAQSINILLEWCFFLLLFLLCFCWQLLDFVSEYFNTYFFALFCTFKNSLEVSPLKPKFSSEHITKCVILRPSTLKNAILVLRQGLVYVCVKKKCLSNQKPKKSSFFSSLTICFSRTETYFNNVVFSK